MSDHKCPNHFRYLCPVQNVPMPQPSSQDMHANNPPTTDTFDTSDTMYRRAGPDTRLLVEPFNHYICTLVPKSGIIASTDTTIYEAGRGLF